MQNKIFPAVIGLGYVGLPIYLNLQKKINTVGFDIDKEKILTLVHICQELGSLNFKRFVRHIMKVILFTCIYKLGFYNSLFLALLTGNCGSFI